MWLICTLSSNSPVSSPCLIGRHSIPKSPILSTVIEVRDVRWSASRQVFPFRSINLECLLSHDWIGWVVQIIKGKALIGLPKRTVNVVSCDFDPSEYCFYESLETRMEGVMRIWWQQAQATAVISLFCFCCFVFVLVLYKISSPTNLLTVVFVKPAITPSLSQRTIRRTWMRLIPRALQKVRTTKMLTAMTSPPFRPDGRYS